MRILLLGELGDLFGEEMHLSVSTPAEAVRAIAVQNEHFLQYLHNADANTLRFQVFTGEREVTEDELAYPTTKEIVFSPVVYGEGGSPFFRLITGAALIGTAFLIPGGVSLFGLSIGSSTLGLIGASLVLGGISQLLSPIQRQTADTASKDSSNIIDRAAQVTRQGARVPVGYGELLITDLIPISSSVEDATTLNIDATPALWMNRITIPLPYKVKALENYSYYFSDRTFRPLNTDFLNNRDPYTGMVVDRGAFNRIALNISFSTNPTGLNISTAYMLQKVRIYSSPEGYTGANTLNIYVNNLATLIHTASLNAGWTELNLTLDPDFNTAYTDFQFVFTQTNNSIPYIAIGELELFGWVLGGDELGSVKAA